MKYILRVPTSEAYAYIEAHFEGEASDAVDHYRELNRLVIGGFGLETKEWNKILDKYLAEGSMSAEDSENMSKEQKWMIHEIDKSISRQEYKNPKGNISHHINEK